MRWPRFIGHSFVSKMVLVQIVFLFGKPLAHCPYMNWDWLVCDWGEPSGHHLGYCRVPGGTWQIHFPQAWESGQDLSGEFRGRPTCLFVLATISVLHFSIQSWIVYGPIHHSHHCLFFSGLFSYLALPGYVCIRLSLCSNGSLLGAGKAWISTGQEPWNIPSSSLLISWNSPLLTLPKNHSLRDTFQDLDKMLDRSPEAAETPRDQMVQTSVKLCPNRVWRRSNKPMTKGFVKQCVTCCTSHLCKHII